MLLEALIRRWTRLSLVAASVALWGSGCVQQSVQDLLGPVQLPLTISVARPAGDEVLTDAGPVEIRWADLGPFDLDGDGLLNDPPDGSTVTIQLDPDDDPDNGNEIDLLGPIDAVPDGDDDRLLFDGLDADGQVVPPGTYRAVARLDDGQGQVLTDTSLGTITVVNMPPELTFTTPGEDDLPLQVGVGGDIVFDYRDREDAIDVQLFLDPDQAHGNGNEIRIDKGNISLAAAFAGGTHTESWDGTDIAGQEVETGTYWLVARIDDWQNPAVTAEAQGKVNVVPDPAAPAAVIVLAVPEVNLLGVVQGSEVQIAWADLTETGSETITLVYSTSSSADQTQPVGAGETEIASGLAALPDDGSDIYWWDTYDLAPETYFIHAKILQNRTVKDVSTAPGTVEITLPPFTPELEFLQPANITDLNFTDPSTLDIVWQYRCQVDGTISLFIDRDTLSTNGNEIVILSNRPQTATKVGTTDQLDWDLTDAQRTDVPTGKYWVRGILNVPGHSAVYATATGQIKVRKTATSPLIELTAPTTTTTFTTSQSQHIQITWDADDPVGDAWVHLWFSAVSNADDDQIRTTSGADFGPITPTDGPTQGVRALPGAFSWLDAGDLTEGTYYIHAVIGGGQDFNNDDDRDTAAGIIQVNAP